MGELEGEEAGVLEGGELEGGTVGDADGGTG